MNTALVWRARRCCTYSFAALPKKFRLKREGVFSSSPLNARFCVFQYNSTAFHVTTT